MKKKRKSMTLFFCRFQLTYLFIFVIYWECVNQIEVYKKQQMKGIFVLTILVLLYTINSSQVFLLFEQYCKQFSKQYSAEQYNQRKAIYQQNIKKLGQITQYIPGVNQFTDQTTQQIHKYRNLKMKQPKNHISLSKITTEERVSLPTNKDWRDYGVVTAIKNQGICGSCWTFAVAAYAESKLIIQSIADKSIDLSEQYLLQCTADSSCDGGYMESVFQASMGGIPLQSTYPYQPFIKYPGICQTQQKNNYGVTLEQLYNINDLDIIRLLQKGPVATIISAQKWESYGQGLFSCDQNAPINHAVLIVGYTKDHWIVKNQWGAFWGEQGFMRITRNISRNCGIGKGIFLVGGQSTLPQGLLKTQKQNYLNRAKIIGLVILLTTLSVIA